MPSAYIFECHKCGINFLVDEMSLEPSMQCDYCSSPLIERPGQDDDPDA